MTAFFLAAVIFLAAGFIQGLTGFGAGLLSIPLLCLFLDIKTAVPLCVLNGIVLTGYLAWFLRSHLEKEKILPLFLGSLPGIFLGGLLLPHVDPDHIRLLLGFLLISYSLYNLAARPRSLHLGPAWGYCAGFCSGVINAMIAAGGPPSIIYTALNDWEKDTIKGTLTGLFFFSSFITALVHACSGTTTLSIFLFACGTAPFILLGTVTGAHVSDHIDRATYLRLIYIFLILMGGMLLAG